LAQTIPEKLRLPFVTSIFSIFDVLASNIYFCGSDPTTRYCGFRFQKIKQVTQEKRDSPDVLIGTTFKSWHFRNYGIGSLIGWLWIKYLLKE
jgi:hypothetical protein